MEIVRRNKVHRTKIIKRKQRIKNLLRMEHKMMSKQLQMAIITVVLRFLCQL